MLSEALSGLTLLCSHRRIPMEDIPEDEDKCSAWLHKLYQEKVGVPSCRVKGGHWNQLLLPQRSTCQAVRA